MFFHPHLREFEGLRDLTDPQGDYSAITAEDVSRFVM